MYSIILSRLYVWHNTSHTSLEIKNRKKSFPGYFNHPIASHSPFIIGDIESVPNEMTSYMHGRQGKNRLWCKTIIAGENSNSLHPRGKSKRKFWKRLKQFWFYRESYGPQCSVNLIGWKRASTRHMTSVLRQGIHCWV